VSFSYLEGRYLAVAELDLYDNDRIETWFWFARLNVPSQIRRRGISKQLLSAVAEWADKNQINIILAINPYGDLDLDQLATLYSKYEFLSINDDGVMIRRV
jgi:GNAT superfamily N-acetyltransferase